MDKVILLRVQECSNCHGFGMVGAFPEVTCCVCHGTGYVRHEVLADASVAGVAREIELLKNEARLATALRDEAIDDLRTANERISELEQLLYEANGAADQAASLVCGWAPVDNAQLELGRAYWECLIGSDGGSGAAQFRLRAAEHMVEELLKIEVRHERNSNRPIWKK